MDGTGMRRCEALTVSGKACRAWAVRGSKPPRCVWHLGGSREQQRCVARTAASGGGSKGNRCRNRALGDGRDLCAVHAGLTARPQGEDDYEPGANGRVGCSAVDAQGARCRQWAMKGSDPPLCRSHGGPMRYTAPTAADRAAGRQCTARTLDGKRCRRWAIGHQDGLAQRKKTACVAQAGRDGGKPLCWLHANADHNGRISHGYYRRIPYLSEAQTAALRALAKDESQLMGAEVALVRFKLQGVLTYLGRKDLTARERLSATELAFEGVRAVSRLLEARNKLQKSEWKPGSAGGAGYLLHRIVDPESEE